MRPLPPRKGVSPELKGFQRSLTPRQQPSVRPVTADVYVPPQKAPTPDDTALRSVRELEQLVEEFSKNEFHSDGRFPELASARLRLKPFHKEGYFFALSKSLPDILLGRTRYVLKYNPDAFIKGATVGGVRGVLAHEFSHAVEYRRAGISGLIREALANIGKNPKSGPVVERRTDLEAVLRGFGPQLKLHRQWLDRVLQGEDKRMKHERCFTADEIDRLLEIHQKNPTQLREWLEDPPRLGQLKG